MGLKKPISGWGNLRGRRVEGLLFRFGVLGVLGFEGLVFLEFSVFRVFKV